MLFCNLFFLTSPSFPSPYFPFCCCLFLSRLLLLHRKKRALRKWEKLFFDVVNISVWKGIGKGWKSSFFLRYNKKKKFLLIWRIWGWKLRIEAWKFFLHRVRRSWMSIFQDNKSTILVEELNRFLKMIFFLFSLFFFIQEVWIVFMERMDGWMEWNGMSEKSWIVEWLIFFLEILKS